MQRLRFLPFSCRFVGGEMWLFVEVKVECVEDSGDKAKRGALGCP